MEKKVRNYTSTCTRQFRIIWLANKGLIYWSVWCNGEYTGEKKYLLNCNTHGWSWNGKIGSFQQFFLFAWVRHRRKLKWDPNEPNDTRKKKQKKTNRTNEVSSIFCTLHLNHSVLLLVTDIKREEKSPKKKTKQKYMKQFRIDKLLSPSTKFWFRLL